MSGARAQPVPLPVALVAVLATAMAEKKAFEVENWLARPDARTAVVLLYGPDRGLVSERAKRLAEKSGVPLDDPFSVVRIDASAGDGEDGRLLTEARMVSMFSARRLLWVRHAGSQKGFIDDVAELTRQPPIDALVLIEASELKKGAPLRKIVEDSAVAMALPCFPDEGKTVDALIDETMRRGGLAIDAEARAALRAHLGGDRLASRGELEKLALYAQGTGRVELADIRALTGDVAAPAMDEMIDHVLAGNGAGFSALYARQMQTPSQIQTLLAAALRQFQTLHLLRGRMENGRLSASAAVSGLRPPPFAARRALLEKALARWTAGSLESALGRIQDAVLEARRRPDLALASTEQALLRLAMPNASRPMA